MSWDVHRIRYLSRDEWRTESLLLQGSHFMTLDLASCGGPGRAINKMMDTTSIRDARAKAFEARLEK